MYIFAAVIDADNARDHFVIIYEKQKLSLSRVRAALYIGSETRRDVYHLSVMRLEQHVISRLSALP